MGRRDTRTPEQIDEDNAREQAAIREERLDAPVSRRELLDALELTAGNFGCNGTDVDDRVAAALRSVMDALS